jgi:hypothetical protein
MLRCGILVALIAALSGCATGEVAITQPDDPAQIAGTWQGHLMGQKSFLLITMVVRSDGVVNITGESFIRATGKVVMMDGKLWLDASAGWYGALVLVRAGAISASSRSSDTISNTRAGFASSPNQPELPEAPAASRESISCKGGTVRV